MRFRSFRSPRWYCRSVHAVSKTGDDSPNDEMGQTECRSLQDSAHDDDANPHEYHLLPTKDVADEYGDDGTEETANIVRSHCNSLNGGYMCVARVVNCIDFGKLSNPGSESQKPSHHTLVIAKEPATKSARKVHT